MISSILIGMMSEIRRYGRDNIVFFGKYPKYVTNYLRN